VSGAYAARRRNAIFDAAWHAALSIGRERLADKLLARSIEGNVEQIYRDGELVGERHVIDNRLGLAILRRLDRLAETGQAIAVRDPRAVALARYRQMLPATPCLPQSIDWTLAVDALRTGDEEAVARALALVKSPPLSGSMGYEVEEVEDPSISLDDDDDDDADNFENDQSDRCWWDDFEESWMTSFAPPAGFTGYESRPYDDIGDYERYVRACTADEAATLEADAAAGRAADRAEDEALRDEWFALLRADLSDDAGLDPDGAVPSTA
jgi:hypothetical protein